MESDHQGQTNTSMKEKSTEVINTDILFRSIPFNC